MNIINALFNTGWSKGRPSPAEMLSWQWREGDYAIEGDSIIASMNPDFISPRAFNIAWYGDTPKDVNDQFPKLFERHQTKPITKAYIEVGGNLWTGHPFNPIDYNLHEYLDSMHQTICLYKTILPARDIAVASLPFVDPDLHIFDMGAGHLQKRLKKYVKNFSINELFAKMSVQLQIICHDEGVVFVNIWSVMKQAWGVHGRSWWYDKIHCSSKVHQLMAVEIKKAWGI
jgi:hypothetical protein